MTLLSITRKLMIKEAMPKQFSFLAKFYKPFYASKQNASKIILLFFQNITYASENPTSVNLVDCYVQRKEERSKGLTTKKSYDICDSF